MLSSSVDVGSARSDTWSIPRSQPLCHPVNPSSTLNFETREGVRESLDDLCVGLWFGVG